MLLHGKQRVPQFREYCAKVKERIGDASGARSSLQYSDTELLSNFVDNINQQANMEKRLVRKFLVFS